MSNDYILITTRINKIIRSRKILQDFSRENWASCFLNVREQFSFHPRKRGNSIPSVSEARQYLAIPFLFSFFPLAHFIAQSENLLPEVAGNTTGTGKDSWSARYLCIDFVPELWIRMRRNWGNRVVQVKPRAPDHFSQILAYKLNSTPPPGERSYTNGPISPDIAKQLCELTSL